MLQPGKYLSSLASLLKTAFRDRLVYMGLQGSYLRGEATEHSDIDVMVVVRNLTVADLAAYRSAIASLEGYEKSCGFICGQEELRHWNPLEICHVLHTTQDYLGTLKDLLPPYTDSDVRAYVQTSLSNLYHELCHRYVHASREENLAALPTSYKAVFFILQNLHYLRSGEFINSKKDLFEALSGQDSLILETSVILASSPSYDFDSAFSLLLSWCKQTMLAL